jgi:hypothetical protein
MQRDNGKDRVGADIAIRAENPRPMRALASAGTR